MYLTLGKDVPALALLDVSISGKAACPMANLHRIDRHTQNIKRVQYAGNGYCDPVTKTASILP